MEEEVIQGKMSYVGELNGKLSKPDRLTGVISEEKRFSGSLSNQILRGYSVYDLAVLNGFDGTLDDFIDSLHGKSVDVEIVDSENGFFLKFINSNGELISPEIYTNIFSSITFEQIDDILEEGGQIG